ncbi:hypothetical protein ACNPNP_08810 [Microbacterium sp. AGC85]
MASELHAIARVNRSDFSASARAARGGAHAVDPTSASVTALPYTQHRNV